MCIILIGVVSSDTQQMNMRFLFLQCYLFDVHVGPYNSPKYTQLHSIVGTVTNMQLIQSTNNWGIPSSDGIPYGLADFFFFFFYYFFSFPC